LPGFIKDEIASFSGDIFLTALGVTGIYFKLTVVFFCFILCRQLTAEKKKYP